MRWGSLHGLLRGGESVGSPRYNKCVCLHQDIDSRAFKSKQGCFDKEGWKRASCACSSVGRQPQLLEFILECFTSVDSSLPGVASI